MRYLEKVRIPEQHYSKTKEALYTVGVLALGICLGAFSKFLDFRQAELPGVLRVCPKFCVNAEMRCK